VGGLVGYVVDSQIQFGSSMADVTSGGDSDFVLTGGLVGYITDSQIIASTAGGDVSGLVYTGGLVGVNQSLVIYSRSLGAVRGTIGLVGGLVGLNLGTVGGSYSRSDVYVEGDLDEGAGGFVGVNQGIVQQSYSTGVVAVSGEAGGFAGGFAGGNEGGGIEASFWDASLGGTEWPTCGDGVDCEGVIASNSVDMKDVATFTTALGEDGWNFDGLWILDPERNDGYPTFSYVEDEPEDEGGGDDEEDPEPEPEVEAPQRAHGGGTSTKKKTVDAVKRIAARADTERLGEYVRKNEALLKKYYENGTKLPEEVVALLGFDTPPVAPATVPDLPVRDLEFGMSGEDVRALQVMLIAAGQVIPPGPTGYFGEYTRSTLAAYQRAHGITPAIGYFGPKTRASIKAAGISGAWW
jgi:peptidoglycan hydrolase-like protein with peptidoglycan-binding domain